MQSTQAGYVPHHQKQSISPLMGSAPSPSMPGQNIPMPNSWASPAPVHGHIPPYVSMNDFIQEKTNALTCMLSSLFLLRILMANAAIILPLMILWQ